MLIQRVMRHSAPVVGPFIVSLLLPLEVAGQERRDEFYYLGEINKASTVMVVEEDIVPEQLGRTIAESVAKVISNANQPGARRSGDYLEVEPLLVAVGGPDVTRLHSGRSRQDIGATRTRQFQRAQLLSTFQALNEARSGLMDLAARNPDAIVPAYTVGVQAQPVSFGHYVLAYTQALARSAERLRRAYGEINKSPLGSAALGTSSFSVNRPRLAALLGFDGVIENSLDANQISPIDAGAELVGIASSAALVVGAFVADLEAQYRMTTPWLTLREGELTGASSIMPQKRNPVALNGVRAAASEVLGMATTYLFKAHNVPHGTPDYKGSEPQVALDRMAQMLKSLATVVGGLEFNAERALDEVNADFATTTELADMLQRDADVPFRVGHHFASDLVTFGRTNGLRPSQIPYSAAQDLYGRAARQSGLAETRFPLSEPEFRRSLSAENMVRASRGLGGPQPLEVGRMLSGQRRQLDVDRTFVTETLVGLERAATRLQASFEQIRTAR
jgi:argininosuccinate lyase